MKEIKILLVLVAFTAALYWGVEPFAHSQMHAHVEPANYNFAEADKESTKEAVKHATKALEEAEASADEKKISTAKMDLENAKKQEEDAIAFWASNEESTKLKGNADNGAALVQANCTACHSIESQGFPAIMDDASNGAAYGVVPPDLGSAGYLYDEAYLVAFVKNPAKATKTAHKFVDGKVHPMPGYDWMQPQEIADIVAYLVSIAPKEMTNKQVFENACNRCHSMKYDGMKIVKDAENGVHKVGLQARTPAENIKAYMGKMPPDLSQFTRSRSDSYLHEFINDPQKHLLGTAMPRVGLKESTENQVVTYLEEVGEVKKAEREALGPKFLIYLVIFAILAWAWKAKIWRNLH